MRRPENFEIFSIYVCVRIDVYVHVLFYDKEWLKLVAKRFYNHANEAAQDGLLVS